MVHAPDDINWIRDAYRQATRRNEHRRAMLLVRSAIVQVGNEARFVQRGRTYSLEELVEHIRSDLDVELLKPFQARLVWSDSAARLWGCDCMERVLDCYEERLSDSRARRAVEAARKFAHGELDPVELISVQRAVRTAATSLVRISSQVTPAWAAAMSAVRCAAANDTWDSGRDAARLAARNAFWSRQAQSEELGVEERAWQCRRLLDYLLDDIVDGL